MGNRNGVGNRGYRGGGGYGAGNRNGVGSRGDRDGGDTGNGANDWDNR